MDTPIFTAGTKKFGGNIGVININAPEPASTLTDHGEISLDYSGTCTKKNKQNKNKTKK